MENKFVNRKLEKRGVVSPGQLKKNDSFSFYLSIAVLLVFLYLIVAYASVRQCVIIICRCPQNIIEISLSRKNVHRNMLSKMPEM
jgi:multidrug efflux pump subunit AcrB